MSDFIDFIWRWTEMLVWCVRRPLYMLRARRRINEIVTVYPTTYDPALLEEFKSLMQNTPYGGTYFGVGLIMEMAVTKVAHDLVPKGVSTTTPVIANPLADRYQELYKGEKAKIKEVQRRYHILERCEMAAVVIQASWLALSWVSSIRLTYVFLWVWLGFVACCKATDYLVKGLDRS